MVHLISSIDGIKKINTNSMIALVIICNDGAVPRAYGGTAGVLEWSRNVKQTD